MAFPSTPTNQQLATVGGIKYQYSTSTNAWTKVGEYDIFTTFLTVTSSTQSTSTVTGALQVAGGVGVGGNINAGGTISALTVEEGQVALGTGTNIDISLGSVFSKTITGTTTFTVSNAPSTGTAVTFILDLTNGGAGTVTWMTGTKWASGTAPTLTASGRDTLAFFTYNGGITWNGFALGLGMA